MMPLRSEQRFWAMLAGAASTITFHDFTSGAWVAGSFGVLITLMTFSLSYAPAIRIVRPMPYPMPPPDQVSSLVGNREIRFCKVGPVPHDVHVWHLYVEDGEAEYACLGHNCLHPERHL